MANDKLSAHMDLNIFKKKDEENQDYYWSLVVGKTWVQAGIWRVLGEKAELVAEGNTTSWEDGNEESLVSACDGSLSSAAAHITEDIAEPNKVVFGLPASWISGGNIAQERLNLLKKISKELELEPSGFVVVPEAIVHYLKTKQGSPLNGILVGIAEDTVEVSLVTNGQVVGTQEVARSISLGTDVAEGLSRMSPLSQYPSRILLYDHKVGNLDEARQNLLKTDWQDTHINFMHTPKVEVLAEDTALSAVSLAGGAEVGQAKTIVLANGVKDETGDSVLPEPGTEVFTEDESSSETAQELEDIGFVEDEDIAQKAASSKTQDFEENLEDIDFDQHDNVRIPDTPLAAVTHTTNSLYKPQGKTSFGRFSKIKNPFSGFRIPFPRTPFGGAGIIGVLGVGIILLLLIGGLAYWYLPRAVVTIYVSPKKLDNSFAITADSQVSVVDLANNILPASFQSVDVSGDKTQSTTGAKTVGDRAKGNVTITNVGGSRVLKSGTVLVGPNNLKFTLNDDVTVASSSSAAKPSQTQAAVSAGDIGAQYNLASGSEFIVGNFSKLDIVATNDEAMSGGTSRDISAVSDKDQAGVLQDLTQELVQKGVDQAKGSAQAGDIVVEGSATFLPSDKTYSNKIGEEASTLKLSLKGKVKVLVMPKDALQSYVISKVSGDVPSGFSLKPEQLQFVFTPVVPKVVQTTAKNKVTKDTKTAVQPTDTTKTQMNLAITANLLPQIDIDSIKKNIAGKAPQAAKDFLASIPGFTRAEIAFKIKLPSSIQTLPRLTKNIDIEVAAER